MKKMINIMIKIESKVELIIINQEKNSHLLFDSSTESYAYRYVSELIQEGVEVEIDPPTRIEINTDDLEF
jgi:adenine C2-methylase RlmN of 23S rRNA A2503 and tRNA A37